MDLPRLPEICPYEEQAIDAVVSVINEAKEKIGTRLTLRQLAKTRDVVSAPAIVSITSLECPLAITSEHLIRNCIEKKWHLTDVFQYVLNYLGCTNDETAHYYYFEAIFSQPTAFYPIPQATASVYFRVEDKHIGPVKGALPTMVFRIEGHRQEHDIRHVLLIPDWILAVIKMKINLFQRIENLEIF